MDLAMSSPGVFLGGVFLLCVDDLSVWNISLQGALLSVMFLCLSILKYDWTKLLN
jgi:hypothetical protein